MTKINLFTNAVSSAILATAIAIGVIAIIPPVAKSAELVTPANVVIGFGAGLATCGITATDDAMFKLVTQVAEMYNLTPAEMVVVGVMVQRRIDANPVAETTFGRIMFKASGVTCADLRRQFGG